MTLLEEGLAKKLERNEIKYLERLSKDLNNYKQRFEALEVNYQRFTTNLEGFNRQFTQQYQSLFHLINETTKKIEIKGQQEYEKIYLQVINNQKQFQEFQGQIIQKYSTINQQNEILRMIENFHELFNDFTNKIIKINEKQQNYENILSSKANLSDLQRLYVKKELFTEILTSLGEEVEKKGFNDDIIKHTNQIEVINILTSPFSTIFILIIYNRF